MKMRIQWVGGAWETMLLTESWSSPMIPSKQDTKQMLRNIPRGAYARFSRSSRSRLLRRFSSSCRRSSSMAVSSSLRARRELWNAS